MNLIPGEQVVLRGEIVERRLRNPRSGGQPFVKAGLIGEDGGVTQVVFWDAGRAPAEGSRAQIKGRVREYRGRVEVHVAEVVVDRRTPPEDPRARVVGFYRDCLEAEAAGSVRVRPGGSGHVELTSGASPLHGPRKLPGDPATMRWCRQRDSSLGETLLGGWPLVLGADPQQGGRLVASPLLISEMVLSGGGADRSIESAVGEVELNPYALDLLGLDRGERDAVVRAVEESTAVEETRTATDRCGAILEVLSDTGVDLPGDLDWGRLGPLGTVAGVVNTGVVMVSSGSSRMIRALLEDLEELLARPELLARGPLGVLMGAVAAPSPRLPEPHPTIVPSTLAQDQAVASAMENVLTVVTGPPGTGKSQVLVNVVAAAVTRGETVLFASKNNKAVDVVFERMSHTSPDGAMVRAGASNRRGEVASEIARILATPRRSVDQAGVRDRWRRVKAQVGEVHSVVHSRMRLEGELAGAEEELQDWLEKCPHLADVDVDPAHLEAALERASGALAEFGRRLGFFGRWRRHRERLERARGELATLGELLGLGPGEMEAPLASVADRPRRSLMPRHDLVPIREMADRVTTVAAIRRRVSDLDRELDALPPRDELDDALHALSMERVAAGRDLLDSCWQRLGTDNPEARTAAGLLAESLEEVASTGRGARAARNRVRAALPTIPVWGVTNLSARTNLPLEEGLFDLVVIDEASQCDVASALPLLARARRALIVGDRRQLVHITSLGGNRERLIARRWGLGDEDLEWFSYRDRSCFGLAASRVDESPIFLNLHFRSHPAIVGFSNEHFYDRRLELCGPARTPAAMAAIAWTRVEGDSTTGPGGRSRVNPKEARALALALAGDLDHYRGMGLSVGVVTPYRAQADLVVERLAEVLAEEDLRGITVATAHRFQGDERDVMYFSPVVGPSMTARQAAFASQPNLVNVALTRARRRLVVVGNIEACLAHRNVLASLARYVTRLEAGGFDSPLEQSLSEALLEVGIAAETGVIVEGHRLDLAVRRDRVNLDLECDGAPFHTDREVDAVRDRAIESAGWRVLRFSGRRLSRDLAGCVEEIRFALA